MENDQEQKLGAGIMTMSIIYLVIVGFSILGSVCCILFMDSLKEQLELMGQNIQLSTGQIAISLVLSLVLLLAIILILNKKAIGVYIYFAEVAVNIIYSIILNGFKGKMVFGLLLPVLMAIFIAQKKEVFGIGVKAQSADM